MTHPAGTAAPPTAPFGYWVPPDSAPPPESPEEFRAAVADLRAPVAVARTDDGFALARGGRVAVGPGSLPLGALPVAAYLPPLAPVVDVRATTKIIDSYVFVVEWGHTRLNMVQRQLGSAPEIFDRPLGVVLNKANTKILDRYEDYYGRYYYKKYYARYGYTQ